MEKRQLGNSDLMVTPIGLGSWAMGNDFYGKVDDNDSIKTIHTALDRGINLIDTAPAYGSGHGEEVVGKAIKDRRNSVIIATKFGVYKKHGEHFRDLSPRAIAKELEDSLRRLGIDCIDLYQIHWPDPKTPLEETVEALVKLKAQGKFRYLGVSNFRPKQMDIVRKGIELVSLQSQYSLLMRTPELKLFPYCKKNNLGVLSYGTLGAGILTGKFKEIPEFKEGDIRNQFYKYFEEPVWSMTHRLLDVIREIAEVRNVPLSQVVINWTSQQPEVTTVLVGAKTPEQAAMNADSALWRLDGDELAKIEEAFQKIFRNKK